MVEAYKEYPDEVPSIELLDRINKNKEYSGKVEDYFVYLLGSFAGVLLLCIALSEIGYAQYLLLILLGVDAILFYWLGKYWIKKLKEYAVESDEWVKYYSFNIFTDLKRALVCKSITERKKNRRKAIRQIVDFNRYISKQWKVGDFKPAKNFVGNVIPSLRFNLKKLIVILKTDNTELHEKVIGTIYNLNKITESFSIEDLRQINNEMNSIYFKQSEKVVFSMIVNPLRSNALRLITIAILATICIAIGFGFNYWGLDKNSSVLASVGIFASLVAATLKMQQSKD